MIRIVWEFQVDPDHLRKFEREYGPEGTWAQLFRRDPAFHGMTLLRDRDTLGRYITIDCWQDLASYEEFRVRYASTYEEIDKKMERLTSIEKKIGVFETT